MLFHFHESNRNELDNELNNKNNENETFLRQINRLSTLCVRNTIYYFVKFVYLYFVMGTQT